MNSSNILTTAQWSAGSWRNYDRMFENNTEDSKPTPPLTLTSTSRQMSVVSLSNSSATDLELLLYLEQANRQVVVWHGMNVTTSPVWKDITGVIYEAIEIFKLPDNTVWKPAPPFASRSVDPRAMNGPISPVVFVARSGIQARFSQIDFDGDGFSILPGGK